MRHLFAVVACLALTGTVANAAPLHKKSKHHHKKKKHKKAVAEQQPAVDEAAIEIDPQPTPEPEVVADAEPETDDAASRHGGHHKRDRVAFEVPLTDAPAGDDEAERAGESENEVDSVDEAPRIHARRDAANDWHFAVGPYLWASSVDANVSVGSASVSSGVDFMQISRHAKYGVELLTQARYDRFSVTGDLMYGVVGLSGGTAVGPVMVGLDGTASSLLIDGNAGYRALGDDHSLVTVEARAGVRYQRTAVNGTLLVAGTPVTSMQQLNASRDLIAGGTAALHPWRRFYVTSAFDIGVVGTSTRTWSASADATVKISSRALLSLGYRTLTMEGPTLSIVMHGPRAAIQLVF